MIRYNLRGNWGPDGKRIRICAYRLDITHYITRETAARYLAEYLFTHPQEQLHQLTSGRFEEIMRLHLEQMGSSGSKGLNGMGDDMGAAAEGYVRLRHQCMEWVDKNLVFAWK